HDSLKLNACGRLLFAASHPQRFADSIAVEISGISDEQGNSPFWDGVCRHFFDVDYAEAERLGSSLGRSVLAELLPGYPLYVPTLTASAPEATGQPRPAWQMVYALRIDEGVASANYTATVAGGPVVRAPSAAPPTARASQVARVRIAQPMEPTGSW